MRRDDEACDTVRAARVAWRLRKGDTEAESDADALVGQIDEAEARVRRRAAAIARRTTDGAIGRRARLSSAFDGGPGTAQK